MLQHAELVLDLGAAGDEHERPLDLAEQPAELPELLEQQESRVRREQAGDALRRGVRAVRRAEGVVHVQVAAVGELTGVPLVVLRLARVEAGVLEHAEPLVGEQLAQQRLDGGDRVPGAVLVGLRAAEVRADPHLGRAAVEQEPQGGQRGADARVVRDGAVLQRHVQVGADQDGLARDLGVADGAREPHRAPYAATAAGSVRPIFATRSTSRQL